MSSRVSVLYKRTMSPSFLCIFIFVHCMSRLLISFVNRTKHRLQKKVIHCHVALEIGGYVLKVECTLDGHLGGQIQHQRHMVQPDSPNSLSLVVDVAGSL